MLWHVSTSTRPQRGPRCVKTRLDEATNTSSSTTRVRDASRALIFFFLSFFHHTRVRDASQALVSSFFPFISSPLGPETHLGLFFLFFLFYFITKARVSSSFFFFFRFLTLLPRDASLVYLFQVLPQGLEPFFSFLNSFLFTYYHETRLVYIYIYSSTTTRARDVSRALLVYFCTYSTTTRHVASRGFIKINFYHLVVQGLEMRVSSPFDFFLVFFSSFFFIIY